MAEHLLVKPEKLIATAVGMLEQELVVPSLFTKHSIDQYKGADNDTVSVPVEGVLPFHEYAWRNDRSAPIVFDEYKETKVATTFGGNVYSAVQLTDEQYDMDLNGWAKLLKPQVKAVARGLSRRAVARLTGAAYNVVIGNAERNLRGAITEARRVLNKFNVPDGSRYLLVGTDFESALLNDEKLNLASNVGDSDAQSALRSASLAPRMGFNIVVSQEIPSDAAFAFASSAFIFLNAAPAVPQSVPFGATQGFEGVSLRWVRDYDPLYMRDRSVVNTYAGFQDVKDTLVGWDAVLEKEVVSTSQHFVRGIKLTLDGASNYPPAASELATITGISDASVWTPTGRFAEGNAANA
ncbi:hypothetical protein FHR83_007100 [Actinoplanes campanulatus]|uniref:Phage major capsid protein E n=1 Tax=Actinoplanes campanulatus TaxID=113559 RepID=A0A7W5AP27_9ACTN|nr:hypothetical protein [Actinoplanes campanulatus]MBB3099394.1 hypothetical protein [Actinoplanes campanulatus]GGN40178.1 hypothetical protein GCM10010109_68920 [Actinoplanes campanulatus]GID42397.1 hypothetical protein Aca09nite_89030 [Actinoplanes campanulatus]